MSANSIGTLFKVTTFGESHGKALGLVIDGLPSGIDWDADLIESFLKRRRPGGATNSARKEGDKPEILSGLYQGKTLGTPLAALFYNEDQRSEDYKNLTPRRGHADKVWQEKFSHVDPRGGGRSSGRETVSRVFAGAVAAMILQKRFPDLKVRAKAKSIYNIFDKEIEGDDFYKNKLNEVGFADVEQGEKVKSLLLVAKEQGESYGGKIEVRVQNPPQSLGQPVFDKVKARLASAVLSVGAVKSFSLGAEADLTQLKGTDFHRDENKFYGGILGGLTTGEEIRFFAEVKPTSSILDVSKKGRHDPCIVPRVLVVLESMVWMTLLDLWLMRKSELG